MASDVGRQAQAKTKPSRIPARSPFYARVLPVMIILLAVLMGLLILVAGGVLLGVVPFR